MRARAIAVAAKDGFRAAREVTGVGLATIHRWIQEDPDLYARLRDHWMQQAAIRTVAELELLDEQILERLQDAEAMRKVPLRDLMIAKGIAHDKLQEKKQDPARMILILGDVQKWVQPKAIEAEGTVA